MSGMPSKGLGFGLKSMRNRSSRKETSGTFSNPRQGFHQPLLELTSALLGDGVLGANEALTGDTSELLSPSSLSLVGSALLPAA